VRCSPGVYCPSGLVAAQGGTVGIICPAGAYCDQYEMAWYTSCTQGYYCPNTGQTQVPWSTSYICAVGFRCPTGSSSAQQIACGPTTYCRVGAWVALDCVAGFYCQGGNPTICPGGYYCPALTGVGTANPCASGTYCPPGSSAPGPTCPAGFYCQVWRASLSFFS
jgi:hypothetical protein